MTLLASLAFVASAAAATQRFTSPLGSGTACTNANPCDLEMAIAQSSDGDDVAVGPGDYGFTQFSGGGPPAITIHGIAGKQRPRVLLIGPLQSGWFLPNGTTLRDLEVDQTYAGKGTLAMQYGDLDRVVVKGASGADCAVDVYEGNVTDSMVVSPGTALCTGADYNSSGTSSFRNVTAISTDAGSVAIDVSANDPNSYANAFLSNVIARGSTNGAGLITRTDSSGAHATTSIFHSNYANSLTSGTNAVNVDAGGNQGAPPKFVDPAQGDYHEAPSSVTIDAGYTQAANGAFDIDGDPRVISTTDIGADEFVPPPPPPPPSAPSSPGTPSTTPTPTPPPASPPSSTPTPPGSTQTPPRPGFAGVILVSTRLGFKHQLIALTLRCPAGTVGRCSGLTKLTARRTVLGAARFSIAAGHRTTVTVRVTRAGRRLLARLRRLPCKDSNAAHNGIGQSKTTVASVTISRVR